MHSPRDSVQKNIGQTKKNPEPGNRNLKTDKIKNLIDVYAWRRSWKATNSNKPRSVGETQTGTVREWEDWTENKNRNQQNERRLEFWVEASQGGQTFAKLAKTFGSLRFRFWVWFAKCHQTINKCECAISVAGKKKRKMFPWELEDQTNDSPPKQLETTSACEFRAIIVGLGWQSNRAHDNRRHLNW